MYPGQLPTVRRDIHNLVIPLDLTDLKDVEMLVENLLAFVKRLVPIRFGVVPLVGSPEAAAQAKIVYHLLESYGLEAAVAYLEAVSLCVRGNKQTEPCTNAGVVQQTQKGRKHQ